jgi:hypothetical protein
MSEGRAPPAKVDPAVWSAILNVMQPPQPEHVTSPAAKSTDEPMAEEDVYRTDEEEEELDYDEDKENKDPEIEEVDEEGPESDDSENEALHHITAQIPKEAEPGAFVRLSHNSNEGVILYSIGEIQQKAALLWKMLQTGQISLIEDKKIFLTWILIPAGNGGKRATQRKPLVPRLTLSPTSCSTDPSYHLVCGLRTLDGFMEIPIDRLIADCAQRLGVEKRLFRPRGMQILEQNVAGGAAINGLIVNGIPPEALVASRRGTGPSKPEQIEKISAALGSPTGIFITMLGSVPSKWAAMYPPGAEASVDDATAASAATESARTVVSDEPVPSKTPAKKRKAHAREPSPPPKRTRLENVPPFIVCGVTKDSILLAMTTVSACFELQAKIKAALQATNNTLLTGVTWEPIPITHSYCGVHLTVAEFKPVRACLPTEILMVDALSVLHTILSELI